jgi:hypothetical protein
MVTLAKEREIQIPSGGHGGTYGYERLGDARFTRAGIATCVVSYRCAICTRPWRCSTCDDVEAVSALLAAFAGNAHRGGVPLLNLVKELCRV